MESKKSYVEFPTPPGFTLPEGSTEGESFEMVGSFKLKPDGKMCLLSVGGLDVSPPQATESKSTGQRMVAAYQGKEEGQTETY